MTMIWVIWIQILIIFDRKDRLLDCWNSLRIEPHKMCVKKCVTLNPNPTRFYYYYYYYLSKHAKLVERLNFVTISYSYMHLEIGEWIGHFQLVKWEMGNGKRDFWMEGNHNPFLLALTATIGFFFIKSRPESDWPTIPGKNHWTWKLAICQGSFVFNTKSCFF